MIKLDVLFLILFVCGIVAPLHGFPIGSLDATEETSGDYAVAVSMGVLLAVSALITLVIVVPMCGCCGDDILGGTVRTTTTTTVEGGRRRSLEAPSIESSTEPQLHSVAIEPLPDLDQLQRRRKLDDLPKPMGFNQALKKGLHSGEDWVGDKYSALDVSQSQLQFVKELENGWFGRVVESEMVNLSDGRIVTVVAKVLKDNSSTQEKLYFLQESTMYRDLKHKNLMSLLGKCLDNQSYFLVFDYYPTDLKSYLIEKRGAADDLIQSGELIRISGDVASGLAYLHQHGYAHNDVACHSCMVSSDFAIKLGDYGSSPQHFKDDYMQIDKMAVPVRWLAPECVMFGADGKTPVAVAEPTIEANVWAFSVVLWEVIEFGKLPYMELTNSQVVGEVIGEGRTRLAASVTPVPHRDRLYQLMGLCWNLLPNQRPTLDNINQFLICLHKNLGASANINVDFDSKWNNLLPAVTRDPLQSETLISSASPIPADPLVEVHEPAPLLPTFDNLSTVENQNRFHTPLEPFVSTSDEIKSEMASATDTAMSNENVISFQSLPSETEEKRMFILTLQDEELAALQLKDLIEFYEFLSPSEIQSLEKRYSSVQSKGQHQTSIALYQENELNVASELLPGLTDIVIQDNTGPVTMHDVYTLSTVQLAEMPLSALKELCKDLSEQEFNNLKLKRMESVEAREGVLSLSDDQLKNLPTSEIERYFEYLSEDEIKRIKSIIGKTNSCSDAMLSSSEKKPVVPRLDTALSVPADDEPVITPAVKDDYDRKREEIKMLTDGDLMKIPISEIETFYQYLTADEIIDFKQRVDYLLDIRKHTQSTLRRISEQNVAIRPKRSLVSPLSTQSISFLSSMNSFGTSFYMEDNFGDPFEAREFILNADDDYLLSTPLSDIEEFYSVLTIEEVDDIKMRMELAKELKRAELLGASKDNLKGSQQYWDLLSDSEQKMVQTHMLSEDNAVCQPETEMLTNAETVTEHPMQSNFVQHLNTVNIEPFSPNASDVENSLANDSLVQKEISNYAQDSQLSHPRNNDPVGHEELPVAALWLTPELRFEPVSTAITYQSLSTVGNVMGAPTKTDSSGTENMLIKSKTTLDSENIFAVPLSLQSELEEVPVTTEILYPSATSGDNGTLADTQSKDDDKPNGDFDVLLAGIEPPATVRIYLHEGDKDEDADKLTDSAFMPNSSLHTLTLESDLQEVPLTKMESYPVNDELETVVTELVSGVLKEQMIQSLVEAELPIQSQDSPDCGSSFYQDSPQLMNLNLGLADTSTPLKSDDVSNRNASNVVNLMDTEDRSGHLYTTALGDMLQQSPDNH